MTCFTSLSPSMSITEDSDDEGELSLFQEPEGWEPEDKPCTYQIYTLPEEKENITTSSNDIKLRFVGDSPLWGHLLWNAARTLATYLISNRARLTENRRVLELGAGAGLPSLVCALRGHASTVVVTDYPDPALVENLRINVEEAQKMMTQNKPKCDIVAQGYLWGADTGPLLEHFSHEGATSLAREGGNKFDLLILGDLLFNHSEHRKLLLSIRRTLARSADARAVVFFTPYRPWLLEKDLAFFDLVQRVGARKGYVSPDTLELSEQQQEEETKMTEDGFGPLKVDKVLERLMDDVMFKEDRGDEKLRRTVFGYELMWDDLQLEAASTTHGTI